MSDRETIAPLSELFLLLPEHERVVLGQSNKIGLANEDSELLKLARLLAIVAVVNVLAVFIFTLFDATQSNKVAQPSIGTVLWLSPAILMFVFMYFVGQRFVCKRKLEREGFLLPGRVVKVKLDVGISPQGIKTGVRLWYEFTTPSNRRITKHEAQERNDLDAEHLPAPGTPVAVIYVSDRCCRVL
jgi:hypothetical protein